MSDINRVTVYDRDNRVLAEGSGDQCICYRPGRMYGVEVKVNGYLPMSVDQDHPLWNGPRDYALARGDQTKLAAWPYHRMLPSALPNAA